MVLEIRIGNFFSIKEEIVLDFQAGSINTEKARVLSENYFTFDKSQFLKVIALYGPNASGKSNIIKAIRFCHALILESHNHNEDTVFNFSPFKFDKFSHRPSTYFIRFVHEGVEYEYSFSIKNHQIYQESLYHFPHGSKAKVFLRSEKAGATKKEIYSFGRSVIKRPFDVAESTSNKTLFLSRASQMDRELPKLLFNYFHKKFILNYLGYSIKHAYSLLEEYKGSFLEALNLADSDIYDFKVNIKKETRKNIEINFLTNEAEIQDILADRLEIKTYHRRDPKIVFDFAEESAGTQKLFFIMLTVLEIIKQNKVLIIDEIEESLHPQIVEYIIKIFHYSTSAQLLFTTHHTQLLNLDLFRKDQIWFVNKTDDASTDLYSLFDFKDFRDTMDLEKAYLQGRFDAVPIVDTSETRLKAMING